METQTEKEVLGSSLFLRLEFRAKTPMNSRACRELLRDHGVAVAKVLSTQLRGEVKCCNWTSSYTGFQGGISKVPLESPEELGLSPGEFEVIMVNTKTGEAQSLHKFTAED